MKRLGVFPKNSFPLQLFRSSLIILLIIVLLHTTTSITEFTVAVGRKHGKDFAEPSSLEGQFVALTGTKKPASITVKKLKTKSLNKCDKVWKFVARN